jgi:hypothetical protein
MDNVETAIDIIVTLLVIFDPLFYCVSCRLFDVHDSGIQRSVSRSITANRRSDVSEVRLAWNLLQP